MIAISFFIFLVTWIFLGVFIFFDVFQDYVRNITYNTSQFIGPSSFRFRRPARNIIAFVRSYNNAMSCRHLSETYQNHVSNHPHAVMCVHNI